MERDRSEKLEERDEHILVLDAGIDVEDMSDPKAVCCRATFMAFRW